MQPERRLARMTKGSKEKLNKKITKSPKHCALYNPVATIMSYPAYPILAAQTAL